MSQDPSNTPPPRGSPPADPLMRGAAGEPRRPSRLRRWLRRIGLAVVALLVAAALGVLALDLGWQRGRLVDLATAAAASRLGLDVEVARVSGRASRGLTLHDVRIGPSEAPLLAVERIEARWRLLSLLGGERRVVDAIRVEGWHLSLRRDATGRWSEVEALRERLAAEASDGRDPEDAPAATAPPIGLRRVVLGPGRIEAIVEPHGVVGLRAEGTLRGLRLGGESPAGLDRLTLEAGLDEAATRWPAVERLDRAELELVLAGRRIVSARATLASAGLDAVLHATGDLDRFERLEVEAHSDDLSHLERWLPGVPRAAGRGRIEARLSGPIDGLVGQVQVEAEGVEISGLAPGSGSGVEASGAEGKDAGGRATDGLRARRLTLEITLDQPIERLPPDPFALAGSLRLTGEDLAAGILGEDLPLREAERVVLEGAIRERRLELARAELIAPGVRLEARGALTPERFERLSVDFELASLAPWLALLPESIRAPLGEGPTGSARGQAELDGPLRAPIGTLRLRTGPLVLAGRAIDPVTLTVERAPDAPARIALAWGPEATPHWQLDARAEPERGRITFEGSGAAGPLARLLLPGRAADGRLALEGRFDGSGEQPEVELAVEGQDLVVDGLELARLSLHAQGRIGGEGRIDQLALDGESGRVALEAPIHWQGSPNTSWRLWTDGVRVTGEEARPGRLRFEAAGSAGRIETLALDLETLPAALLGRLAGGEVALDGELAGNARWQASGAETWTRGALEWTRPGIERVRLDDARVTWTGREDVIEGTLSFRAAGLQPLEVAARARVPGSTPRRLSDFASIEATDLQAELDELDLATFGGLTPRWMRRLSGRVSGSLRLSPGPEGPRPSGELRLAEAGFTVPLLRRRFAPIEGRLVLDDQRLSIDDLRLGGNGHGAVLEASVDLSQSEQRPIRGRLRLDRLAVSRSPLLEMDVEGVVDLSGTLARPTIEGELAVASTRVRVPAADDPVLKEIQIATRGSSEDLVEREGTAQDPLENATLDLSLRVPDTTRIRGQGANLFVQGQARVTKQPGEPTRLRGEANVVNGTYTFQSRRFRVRRGSVRLTGAERLDPVLDIEAHLSVKDIVAIVEVSGRLSAPTVRLTSSPERSEQDVLAYLIFGRPASEVGAAQSERFDAAATRLVAGVAEHELREILGDAMPVDSIEIGADDEGATSELGFGKYLGPDLFIRYVHVLGDEPADRVGVEYRLNDLFSVGSSVSTTGDAGVDLILRHDF